MVVLGLVLYFTSPDASVQGPSCGNDAATAYQIADRHDAYASSDRDELCVTEDLPIGRRSAGTEDGALSDGEGADTTVREGCSQWDRGSKAMSVIGNSPRQNALNCSPVLSYAPPVVRQQTWIDEARVELLEKGGASGHGTLGRRCGDEAIVSPVQRRKLDELEDVLEQ